MKLNLVKLNTYKTTTLTSDWPGYVSIMVILPFNERLGKSCFLRTWEVLHVHLLKLTRLPGCILGVQNVL